MSVVVRAAREERRRVSRAKAARASRWDGREQRASSLPLLSQWAIRVAVMNRAHSSLTNPRARGQKPADVVDVLLQLGVLIRETFTGGGQIFYFSPIILNFPQDGLKLLNLVLGGDGGGGVLGRRGEGVGLLDGLSICWL
jgi:hypothetical protein